MIKIHILEDSDKKYSLIENFLDEGEFSGKLEVSRSTCVYDAREAILRNEYDILLVDIFIPTSRDDEAEKSNGFQFLRECCEAEYIQAPKYIVAISAYEEAVADFQDSFGGNLWNILSVTENDSEWKKGLRQLIQHNIRVKKGFQGEVDVVWLCALNSPELRAVVGLSPDWKIEDSLLTDYRIFSTELKDLNGKTFKVWCASLPRMGMVSAAVATQYFLFNFAPKVILMSGICATPKKKKPEKDDPKLGDLVIAQCCWNYEAGKWSNGEFEFSPHQVEISTFTSNLLTEFAETNKPNLDYSIFCGPMASGSSVLCDDARVKDLIKGQNRKSIGIDMEVYGVYDAAKSLSAYSPVYFAVKGISDFADSKKNDDYQEQASENSARFCWEFLKSNFHRCASKF